MPSKGAYAQWVEDNLSPGYRSIPGVHARLDVLEEAGLIHWRTTGSPRLKRYLAASKGEAVSDFIGDIQNVNNRSKEYVGYPTQKPLALLDRIIRASSNDGDVVLDPFCGCATALVSAEMLGRQWIGIDLSDLAVNLVLSRLERPLTMARCSKAGNCRTSTTERTSRSVRTSGNCRRTRLTATRSTASRKVTVQAAAFTSHFGI